MPLLDMDIEATGNNFNQLKLVVPQLIPVLTTHKKLEKKEHH